MVGRFELLTLPYLHKKCGFFSFGMCGRKITEYFLKRRMHGAIRWLGNCSHLINRLYSMRPPVYIQRNQSLAWRSRKKLENVALKKYGADIDLGLIRSIRRDIYASPLERLLVFQGRL
jgi:hypothetical protein